MRDKTVGTFQVYLCGGQSFIVKAKSIDLKWDSNGNVTNYDFQWPKPQERLFAMPPQSIIGIRRIK